MTEKIPFITRGNGLPWNDPDHKSLVTTFGGRKAMDPHLIETFLSDRGLQPSSGARYAQQREILERANARGTPANLLTPIEFKQLYGAVIDLMQMRAVIGQYVDLKKIPLDLKAALFKDPIDAPDRRHSPGRDLLLEYYAGARFKAAGCQTTKCEPDFGCTFEEVDFSVAVKRFHIGRLEANIRSARKQIIASRKPGVIVLDLTQSSPFKDAPLMIGTSDTVMEAATAWFNENYLTPLTANGRRWGLDGRQIPHVCCLHFVCFYDVSHGMLAITQQMFTFQPGPLHPPSRRERAVLATINRAVESVRQTLP